MLRRTVALVVAFIAAFFALPAADASPPDATKQSFVCVCVCVYASPAHDLPINHTAPGRGPSAQRPEAAVSTGQRAADRASHGVLVRPDAPGTCGRTTYDSTAQLVQVDNPGTTTPKHVGAPDSDPASLQRSHVAAEGGGTLTNRLRAVGAGGERGSVGIGGDHLSAAIARGARTTSSWDDIARRLQQNHGISPEVASERLHVLKRTNGLGGADNVVFDRTGNVFDPRSGDLLGSLTHGGAGGFR